MGCSASCSSARTSPSIHSDMRARSYLEPACGDADGIRPVDRDLRSPHPQQPPQNTFSSLSSDEDSVEAGIAPVLMGHGDKASSPLPSVASNFECHNLQQTVINSAVDAALSTRQQQRFVRSPLVATSGDLGEALGSPAQPGWRRTSPGTTDPRRRDSLGSRINSRSPPLLDASGALWTMPGVAFVESQPGSPIVNRSPGQQLSILSVGQGAAAARRRGRGGGSSTPSSSTSPALPHSSSTPPTARFVM